jgi:hypothetical protein
MKSSNKSYGSRRRTSMALPSFPSLRFINSLDSDVFGSRMDHPNPSPIGAPAQQELFQ